MLRGIFSFEIRYQLRNPVLWVAIAIFFLLGFGLTASENVSIGTPGGVHQNAPYRDRFRHRHAHAFLSVRDHRVRRQRHRSRRHERLRADRPRDLRLRQAISCSAASSAGWSLPGWAILRFRSACSSARSCRGSTRKRSALRFSAYYLWPFLRVRDPEHPHDERAAVRARDDAAIDDGVLHRCGRTGVGLSHHHQHPRAEGRIPRHIRAVRAARRRRFAGRDALLDPVRDEQRAGRSGRYGAVQPRLWRLCSACCSSASPCGASP